MTLILIALLLFAVAAILHFAREASAQRARACRLDAAWGELAGRNAQIFADVQKAHPETATLREQLPHYGRDPKTGRFVKVRA